MKTMKVRIKDKNLLPYLKHKIFSTKHFENILLILIHQDYKQNEGKMFKHLTEGKTMRAVLRGTSGGKRSADVELVREHYKDNELMKSLIEASKELKIHNLVEQIKDVKKNYRGYFTNIELGNADCRPPKPKKLSKVSSVTVFMDSYKSFTTAKYDKIGLNLCDRMRYTHVKHDGIKKVVGELENIRNISINYSNGNVYMLIAYDDEQTAKTVAAQPKPYKAAAMDIGVTNLAAIYIEDEDTPSLIVDGTRFKSYNANCNKLLSEISSDIDFYQESLKNPQHNALNAGLDVVGQVRYLSAYRSFLYEKRNNFFYSEFHKISNRILEYLSLNGVTHFVVSRNLAELKNNGNCELASSVKQSFIQIPFMQLVDKITEKAPAYGITVTDVNEAYTSKTSSLSADISFIQEQSKTINLSTNDYCGSRVKRGMFKDHKLDIIINADLNGSRNILKLGSVASDRPNLMKLCNPIKKKCDSELLMLINNSMLDKRDLLPNAILASI